MQKKNIRTVVRWVAGKDIKIYAIKETIFCFVLFSKENFVTCDYKNILFKNVQYTVLED